MQSARQIKIIHPKKKKKKKKTNKNKNKKCEMGRDIDNKLELLSKSYENFKVILLSN